MRFLVDAQLPYMLCSILSSLQYDAIHAIDLPNQDRSADKEIREYADNHQRILVTKDTDFYHSHMALDTPKKLLLISTGNIRNRQLFDLFRKFHKDILVYCKDADLVELTNTSIIVH